MKEQVEELVKSAKEVGAMGERDRIMKEILAADLGVGVWSAIADIINPKFEKHE